jgi:hypothetical protein
MSRSLGIISDSFALKNRAFALRSRAFALKNGVKTVLRMGRYQLSLLLLLGFASLQQFLFQIGQTGQFAISAAFGQAINAGGLRGFILE